MVSLYRYALITIYKEGSNAYKLLESLKEQYLTIRQRPLEVIKNVISNELFSKLEKLSNQQLAEVEEQIKKDINDRRTREVNFDITEINEAIPLYPSG